MPEVVWLERNPWARLTVIRRMTEVDFSKTCEFCGQQRKTGKLFQYGHNYDGGTLEWHPGHFCSRGCYDSYYG